MPFLLGNPISPLVICNIEVGASKKGVWYEPTGGVPGEWKTHLLPDELLAHVECWGF